jgi:hypothetical protein
MQRGVCQLGFEALLAVAVCGGCANFTSPMKASDPARPTSAFIYGRFEAQAPVGLLSNDASQTLGFVIRCGDGSEYRIKFSTHKGIQVIEVKPSRCSFVEVFFTDGDSVVRKRELTPDNWSTPHEFVAGRAYYLGDFHGTSTMTTTWMVVATKYEMRWGLDHWQDSYDTSTVEMQRAYPNLAALPTADNTLVPRRPGERRPKLRGPGDPAIAPGEVMTPDRIARIASFSKRRYATPAQCEEACPMGECLPFRGDAGPAMTCVVRCKADKDCPAGLACNCAANSGPACRPIATAPADPMDGLCLSRE